MHSTQNRNVFWSILLLLLLAGCTSGQRPSAHAVITPTPTALLLPTLPPTPTDAPLPFLPHDHDPFQATFIEHSHYVTCPPPNQTSDICFNVSGSGTSIPYGSITFTSFDTSPNTFGNSPECVPQSRLANVVIGKDTVKITANGPACRKLVSFSYVVTGGTGKFQHARGNGSISIPAENPTRYLLEYWTGTLVP